MDESELTPNFLRLSALRISVLLTVLGKWRDKAHFEGADGISNMLGLRR